VKTTFKLKINIKRNPLNFKSIQWKHMQAFPIWWDYPFKIYTCNFLSIIFLIKKKQWKSYSDLFPEHTSNGVFNLYL
jgi:hypothetical protein